MNESPEQPAPPLGEATDAQDAADEPAVPDDEPTMDTPDELGGTGGRQPGGAG